MASTTAQRPQAEGSDPTRDALVAVQRLTAEAQRPQTEGSDPTRDALVAVQRLTAEQLNDALSVEQSIESSEHVAVLAKVHFSLAWMIGAWSHFGDEIDVVAVLRRMYPGNTDLSRAHGQAADLLELKLAATKSAA